MELIDVPLASLDQHPQNPRHDVGDVTELAASIRKQGLLEPLVIAPAEAEGRYILIAGHRRTAAGLQAKMPALPAMVRYDLDTPARQLEAMLVENLHRTDLTPVEEAEGYAQLRLFGYKPAQIASATGRAKSTVDKRLSLTKLPDGVRGRLHAGKITLGDAEKLVEFAGDPDMLKRLEAALGTYNFDYMVTSARQAKASERTRAKALAALKADGVTVIDQPARWGIGAVEREVVDVVGPLDYDDLDADAAEEAERKAIAEHAACEHHAAFLRTYNAAVVYVCRQPDSHPDWEERQAALDDREGEDPAAEKAKAEKQAMLDAASETRVEHVRGLLAAKQLPVVPLLRRHVRAMVGSWNFDGDRLGQVLELLGIDPPKAKAKEKRRPVVLEYVDSAAAVDDLLRVMLAYSTVTMELSEYGSLRVNYGWSHRDGKAQGWIDTLTATGYQPSDVDLQLLAEAKAEHDRLYAPQPPSPAAEVHLCGDDCDHPECAVVTCDLAEEEHTPDTDHLFVPYAQRQVADDLDRCDPGDDSLAGTNAPPVLLDEPDQYEDTAI